MAVVGVLELVCGVVLQPDWLTIPRCKRSSVGIRLLRGDYVAFSWAVDVVSTWCLRYQCNTQITPVSPPGLHLRLAFTTHLTGTVLATANNLIE